MPDEPLHSKHPAGDRVLGAAAGSRDEVGPRREMRASASCWLPENGETHMVHKAR